MIRIHSRQTTARPHCRPRFGLLSVGLRLESSRPLGYRPAPHHRPNLGGSAMRAAWLPAPRYPPPRGWRHATPWGTAYLPCATRSAIPSALEHQYGDWARSWRRITCDVGQADDVVGVVIGRFPGHRLGDDIRPAHRRLTARHVDHLGDGGDDAVAVGPGGEREHQVIEQRPRDQGGMPRQPLELIFEVAGDGEFAIPQRLFLGVADEAPVNGQAVIDLDRE